tara:strand:+ start:113 stop:295 length:183 start_codon:yes stop_codon:yes gene_type:complete
MALFKFFNRIVSGKDVFSVNEKQSQMDKPREEDVDLKAMREEMLKKALTRQITPMGTIYW